MANDNTAGTFWPKDSAQCPACFGYINIREIHDCMNKPTTFPHEHCYKVLQTEVSWDGISFVFMTCGCGSVIKVRPKVITK